MEQFLLFPADGPWGAEIRIHPSGRSLYNTNRGHNSVTMFEIEPETGELDVTAGSRRAGSGHEA